MKAPSGFPYEDWHSPFRPRRAVHVTAVEVPLAPHELGAQPSTHKQPSDIPSDLHHCKPGAHVPQGEEDPVAAGVDGTLSRQSGAIAFCLASGDIVAASPSWSTLVGRVASRSAPIRLESVLDEGVDRNLVRDLSRAIAEGQAHSVELLCRGPDNTRFWNDLVVTPSGGAGCWLVFRDVTARRAAERALGAIPSIDRLLLERVQSGVVVHRANTEILYANAKATELLGVTAHSVVGAVNTDPRWSFIDGDGRTLPIEEYPVAQAVRMRTVVRNILLGVRRVSDGRLTWILCDAYPVVDSTGEVVEVVVSFTEVTSLKETERALQKSQERLELILRGSTDAPWDNDFEHGEAYYSPQWYAMVGYTPGTVEEDRDLWSRLVHPDDRPRLLQSLQRLLDDPQVFNYELEFRFVHRDGHLIHVLSRAIILRDASGKPRRVAGTNSDITERRALEERLRQSQKLEAIGQLAGGIAHDFNNLLAVISGNLELMLSSLPETSELREFGTDALRAAERGAQLTRRLLAFARQEHFEPAPVDVGETLRNVSAVLRRVINESISIDVQVPPALAFALTDAGLLENALLNLAINARDAMPDGGSLVLTAARDTVTVAEGDPSTRGEVEPGEYVRLDVRDSGTGMSQEILARALEPFFTTKPIGQGTGLGLAMVYGFVRQSGGAMRIASTPGGGTTVSLLLPIAPAGSTRTPVQQATDLPQETKRAEVVLLVEDDSSVRATCRRALDRMGFAVHEASDGPSALRLAGDLERIDLVITDVIMPGGMNGPDLASAIRSRRPGVPIIFMSGYHADILATESRRDDFHLLSKPFTIAELQRAVRQALPRRASV